MESNDSYNTIVSSAEAEFKDRGSKFLAYLKAIENETDFHAWLDNLKSQHHKANHHCFAYRLLDDNLFRYSDDGEPSGTAGRPIYNQLISSDLKNVACVVVRYFGGTKLGTSGLIQAYRESCALAIAESDIVTKYITQEVKIIFDYAIMGQLMDIIKLLGIDISSSHFDHNPYLIAEIRESQFDNSIKQIKSKMLGWDLLDITEDTQVPGLSFEFD